MWVGSFTSSSGQLNQSSSKITEKAPLSSFCILFPKEEWGGGGGCIKINGEDNASMFPQLCFVNNVP